MKKPARSVLFITVGAPGSGKSYFSERICREFKMVHLRSDKIRDHIFKNPTYNQKENRILFGFIDFLTDELLSRGVSVVYDANFTKRSFREKLRRIAKKRSATYAILLIKTPIKTSIKRAHTRKYRPIHKSIVISIHKETEKPAREPVIVLNGVKSFRSQKGMLTRFLKK